MSIIPANTPQAALATITAELSHRDSLFKGGLKAWPVVILGWRGYFLDTMGRKGKNDRGIYDDAIFIISPTCFRAFNANVDPSLFRDKVASLIPEQVVYYKKGMHRAGTPGGHMAWRQSSPVIVQRDEFIKPKGVNDSAWGISLGNGQWTDKNWPGGIFAINLHKGGTNTTSSLGCQTIPPKQWAAFFETLTEEQDRHNSPIVPYLLIHDPRMA
jgi:lysozyme